MFDVVNSSPWSCFLAPGWNRTGEVQTTVVIKASFDFDTQGKVTVSPAQDPVVLVDSYRDDPMRSSLMAANESVSFKEGAEFYLYGTAHPPEGATAMKVGVGIVWPDGENWQKTIAVIGKRKWLRKGVACRPGPPEPLKPVPIIYENAFGGVLEDNEEILCEENPAGMGFNPGRLSLIDPRVPCVESLPIMQSPSEQPSPAGFGPISPLWEPRVSTIGELVESDDEDPEKCPYTTPMSPVMFHYAPSDQWFPRPFEGGEQLALGGLVEGVPATRAIVLTLPALQITVSFQQRAQREKTPVPILCDTLIVDTDKKKLSLVFRGAIPGTLPGEKRRGAVVVTDQSSSRGSELELQGRRAS